MAKVYVSSIVTKNHFDVIEFRVLLKVAVPIVLDVRGDNHSPKDSPRAFRHSSNKPS